LRGISSSSVHEEGRDKYRHSSKDIAEVVAKLSEESRNKEPVKE